jgi:hypothetical protein
LPGALNRELAERADVVVTIHDDIGRRVRQLVAELDGQRS